MKRLIFAISLLLTATNASSACTWPSPGPRTCPKPPPTPKTNTNPLVSTNSFLPADLVPYKISRGVVVSPGPGLHLSVTASLDAFPTSLKDTENVWNQTISPLQFKPTCWVVVDGKTQTSVNTSGKAANRSLADASNQPALRTGVTLGATAANLKTAKKGSLVVELWCQTNQKTDFDKTYLLSNQVPSSKLKAVVTY